MSSTSYPKDATDWRGLFIKNLLEALAEHPELKLSYWGPPGEIPSTVNYSCLPAESVWLSALLERGGIAHVLSQGGIQRLITPSKLLWSLRSAYRRSPQPDLYHINWLQNALPLWGTRQPAIISVLGSDLGLLKLPGMAMTLRQVFRQRRTILAPNAEWMEAELKQHFADVAEIMPIPFGIDRKWFQLERSWPQSEKNKWLVILRLTKKKIGPLFEWGKEFFTENNELHLFGPMQEELTIPDWIHYHGPSHPTELLPWFAEAAGMITLSQHDEGRPQVLLEAMAAGLPIIASTLPAHDDLLSHGETGYLCNAREDFINALSKLSTPEVNLQVGQQARHWVKEHIGTWEDCAQRYMAAYRLLL